MKKIEMQQNGGFLKKTLKFYSKIWWFLAWKNYIFHSIIKLEGHCIEKQIHNKLKKDSSRSDDLLSSYSCSKFEKCRFEKNAFKDKSRQSPNFKLVLPLKVCLPDVFDAESCNFENKRFLGTSSFLFISEYLKYTLNIKKSIFAKFYMCVTP